MINLFKRALRLIKHKIKARVVIVLKWLDHVFKIRQRLAKYKIYYLPSTPTQNAIQLSNFTQSGNYTIKKQRRNVIFFRNSYYHFYYLAQALRRRNWDVITVSLENPATQSSMYYHGEDINLYSDIPDIMINNLNCFFEEAKKRFDLIHFANDFGLSFFPYHYDDESPADIVEWKSTGKKIAYTISGCMSMTTQSSVAKWSKAHTGRSVCDSCRWKDVPIVCCDEKNDAWGKKATNYVDMIFAEGLPALDYIVGPNVIREPTTMCLDQVVWHPDLPVPPEYQIKRKHNEIFIYHGVGNYKDRTNESGKNIKGTPAVLASIERLQDEGYPVRLIFVTDQINREVRYTQVQADIIVDQLNYGRYGATAREGMMLGKPVVCYINPVEERPEYQLRSLNECPLISADEYNVYEVLKDLIDNPEKRSAIGKASRQYALKWHSADACAERYEAIYDALMNENKITFPEDWHYFEPTLHKTKLHSHQETDNLTVIG